MSPETEKQIQNSCTIKEAKEILGEKNVFGPDEWKKFFGDKFQLEKIPEIPWSKDILEKPEIGQDHFLFLGTDKLDEKPLNIREWYLIYKNRHDNPRFHRESGLEDAFTLKTCEPQWYFMTIGKVKGSENKKYSLQLSEIPTVYKVPTAIERVTGNILYHLINQKYLDHYSRPRTADVTDRYDYLVIMEGNPDDGLTIFNDAQGALKFIGVAASRRNPEEYNIREPSEIKPVRALTEAEKTKLAAARALINGK